MQIAEQRAVVVQIGSAAWEDEREHRAYPGAHVMVTRFAGIAVVGPLDGKNYRLVNDRDIFCRITEEGVKADAGK